ncbi:aquaporin-like protein [Ophiobolus disseminans]|uniref:Aquaporin-like protein n=1 Tax=Ophiobolus disseminans TaxID=1469910 RepID=A0A6A6ZYX6_9PLEO|nr:aquaporin-like protein [Ophiobolus disseminans]
MTMYTTALVCGISDEDEWDKSTKYTATDEEKQDRHCNKIRDFLDGLKVPPQAAGPASYMASFISFWREQTSPKALDAAMNNFPAIKIVQDADRLDELSAMGVPCTEPSSESYSYYPVKSVLELIDGRFVHFPRLMKIKTGRKEAEKAWALVEEFKAELLEQPDKVIVFMENCPLLEFYLRLPPPGFSYEAKVVNVPSLCFAIPYAISPIMTGASTSKDLENAAMTPHELRHRRHSHLTVASRPFAGRLGGNQEFTSDDASLFTNADAIASFSWHQSFHLEAFADIELWKESFIECVGTCLQVYTSGLVAAGLSPLVKATSLGPVAPAAFGGLVNLVLISLFIFAAGPVSGGHFNPLITMSTFTARLSIFPRTLLYVMFQCLGAVVAGFLLRASLGVKPEEIPPIPGCYIDTSLVSPGEAYALETMTSFVLIFIAFGVGLDPRQREVFGPALSPILIGLTQCLVTFASSIARPGYSGSGNNPARCLGLMTATNRFDYHYVHWAGPITTAILNGVLYWVIPIYKE